MGDNDRSKTGNPSDPLDPRPDRQDREHKSPETDKHNKPYEAPGGLGTGGKDAPENNTPEKQRDR